MPDIKDSVGDGGTNARHDVALVEAMLRVVKNAGNQPYFSGAYNGTYDNATKKAITKFQKDHNLQAPAGAAAPPAGTEKSGFLGPGGPTIQKLSAMLPATHADLITIANVQTVFLAGTAAAAAESAKAVRQNNELLNTFRENVAKLVEEMYAQHKIVISLAGRSGGRRDFAAQSVLFNTWLTNAQGVKFKPTQAGPGESNHNFGRAVDVGPDNLKWLQDNGTFKTDDWWLNRLSAVSQQKFNEFYNKFLALRDAIAVNTLGLFRLVPGTNADPPHLQAFDDTQVSSRRSLAKLLTKAGTMNWQVAGKQYKCDLGFGKALHMVGTADQIWKGQALVTKQMLAQGLGVPAAQVKTQQVNDMKRSLKQQFELADQNWRDWEGVP